MDAPNGVDAAKREKLRRVVTGATVVLAPIVAFYPIDALNIARKTAISGSAAGLRVP